MATKSDIKEESTSSNEVKNIDLKLNEETLSSLSNKKQIQPPQFQYYGESPFTEYIDRNAVFFSQLDSLEENEKTAYLITCLSSEVYRLLRLTRPNTALANCKYSELVDDLTKSYAETVKYAEEYSKLLLIKDPWGEIKDIHRTKQAEWKNLEEVTSQKIPDIVKVLILFDHYKEPVKSVAEKYIQEHHDKINLDDFITFINNESLFLKEIPSENSGGSGKRRYRSKKNA